MTTPTLVVPPAPPNLSDPSTPFRWAVGVEGSFIPHLGIDQYEWTQHDRFWREDFRLIGEDLRCRWCRYPVPWHTLEPAPGVYDWTWTDARFDLADELGLRLMVDLAHFGTPTWLPDAFADPEFPEAIRRFSRAFGQRYAGRPCVPTVCPVNEPLITALFCGDVGLWPPYGRGLDSYMTVLSRIAQGICLGIRELRDTMPGVEIIVCDSLEVAATSEPDSSERTSPFLRESLGADVARRMERRHIVMDLVLGNVTPRHPLHDWMRRHGFAGFDVRWFDRNRQRVDIVGLDYYPHTEVELYTSPEGYYRQRAPERPAGLHRAAQDYWHRHGLPLMITETSVTGADQDKLDWLQRSTDDVRRLRAEGFPVVGYTWWPAIDHVDWDGAMLHQTGHVHPVGIYRLERGPGGKLRRAATGLRDAYRALIDAGDAAAGELRAAEGAGRKAGAGVSGEASSPGSRPPALRPAPSAFPLVFFSREPWAGVWTRPQQLASRLQLRGAVLFVDPVKWTFDDAPASTALQAFPHYPNLYVLTPRLPDELRAQPPTAVAGELRRLVALALGRAPLAGRFTTPAVHWFDDPAAVPAFLGWDGLTVARRVVYDCREKWTAFPGADPALADAERRLLGVADVTFARGRRLCDELRAGNVARRVEFLPDGVDAHGYIRATRHKTAVPHDSEFIKRPTLGYLGRVDGRLDFGLIAALADADPDWNLVFIGPVGADLNPNHLPRRQNVYWLGARPPERLPDYLKGLDLVILPYASGVGANPWHIPAKLPEALLGGRPVVASAALPEIAADPLFVNFVDVGATPEEFIHLCRQAIHSPDPKRRRGAMRGAADRHWRKTVARVGEVLGEEAATR